MTNIFETERLALRKLSLNDSDFIIELLNSAGWLKFIGDRNVRTREQAHAYLENGPFKNYLRYGFGLCAVQLKENKKPIGMCGLLWREQLETPDIGYALLPAYHGSGYASEIVNEVLAYAKGKLGIEKISAITLPDNLRSINVLTKAGFRFYSEFTFPGSTELLHLYRNY